MFVIRERLYAHPVYLPADSKSYTARMNLGRLSLNKLWGVGRLRQKDAQLFNAAVRIA